ncbi:unnamed protein product [Dicrocoelium dendriticum]|nr:unnamed protein product [Dicrocoelium dendriticum]
MIVFIAALNHFYQLLLSFINQNPFARFALSTAQRLRDRGEQPELSEVTKPSFLPPPASSNATVCRLQLRLPTGPPLKAEFGASEPLSAVILYISQRWPDSPSGVDPASVCVFTTFPKKDYTEADLQTPLCELGLCPSAVLMARRSL